MYGLAVDQFHYNFEIPLGYLFILGLDVIGLVLILIPMELSNQLGFAWTGVMSVVLWINLFTFTGAGPFGPDAMVILFLAAVEILVVIKLVLDQLAKQIHEVEAS